MPPPDRAGQDQRVPASSRGHSAVCANQPREVLSRLERSNEQDIGRANLETGQHFREVSRTDRQRRSQRHHVDALSVDSGSSPELFGGVARHGQDRI